MVLDGSWEDWEQTTTPTSVTIGVLDGVHIGHRALISRLDPERTPTVLTFDPHPVEVLRPGTHPRLITTIGERIELFDTVGVERVGVLDLAEIKDQAPEEFVERVLVGRLGVSRLVVGADFRFGKDRAGDVALLASMGVSHDYEVDIIDLVASGDSPVSSSRIRGLIESGAVAEAAGLLGSWFRVSNTVIGGDRRGRSIGFPTANIQPPKRKVMPSSGVYACFATVRGVRYDAAVNVGVRPTFGGDEWLIEAFLLDFDEDIYGNEITVEFVEYLRPELKFSGVGDLVDRMEIDVVDSQRILEEARTRI